MPNQETIRLDEILSCMHTPQVHIDPKQARIAAEVGKKVLEIFLMALDAYEKEQKEKE